MFYKLLLICVFLVGIGKSLSLNAAVIEPLPYGDGLYGSIPAIITHARNNTTVNGFWTVGMLQCRVSETSPSGARCADLETLTSCTFGGIANPANFGPFTVGGYWDTNGTLLVDGPHAGTAVNNRTVYIRLSVNSDERIYAGPASIPVECITTIVSTNMNFVSSWSGGNTIRSTFTITVNNSYGHIVSVPTQMSGVVNDTVMSRFDITSSGLGGDGAQLSWSVQPPCASWNPTLQSHRVNVIPPIPADGITATPISNGVDNMTATFTPTEAGEFSCTGILTFSYP